MNRIFEVNYAGIPVRYRFRRNSTARYFSGHIRLSASDVFDISMDDAYFGRFRKIHPEDVEDDYVEYKGLIYLTATFLLRMNCSIFHAVSFIWKGKAWLLSGKSGTGKTTQYQNWKSLFPEEIQMISGDMPLLDLRSGKILVHPSPWNGKEGYKGSSSAELGGIIFLEQGKENHFRQSSLKENIFSLFHQFCAVPNDEEEVTKLSFLIERILREVPLWTYVNDGTAGSTLILKEELSSFLRKERQDDQD
ncbi:MAG: hypothetical protein IIZ33_01345 [Erysipelotrichaceae bacterium]|nr:hypothetical protein [Erysipelotrichaceae bacterium]